MGLALLPAAMGEAEFRERWKPLEFPSIEKHTVYAFQRGAHGAYVVSSSSAAASGLIHEFAEPVPLGDIAKLSWRWRVDTLIEPPNHRVKPGDDYAARVYLSFKYDPAKASFADRIKFGLGKAIYGRYPPKGALAYVWAGGTEEAGATYRSPYAGSVLIVVAEAGPGRVGEWVAEERDPVADFRAECGPEAKLPLVQGLAIMTDSDRSGGAAAAAFAGLELHLRNALKKGSDPDLK